MDFPQRTHRPLTHYILEFATLATKKGTPRGAFFLF